MLYQVYDNSSVTSPDDIYLYSEEERLQAVEDTAEVLRNTLDLADRLNTGDCELLTSIWIERHAAMAYADTVLVSYKAKPFGVALSEMEIAITRLTEAISTIAYGCDDEE